MDECEEDCIILQVLVDQDLEEQPSPGPSTDCVERPAADQEAAREDKTEWDTDLEADGGSQSPFTNGRRSSSPRLSFALDAMDKNRKLSRAEVYRKACLETAAVPISAFLRNPDQTHLDLSHYNMGPVGARALAMALQVRYVSGFT